MIEIPVTDEHAPAVADGQARFAERDLIERALQRLTVEERTVLVLRHYADLSLVEAADVLGIPVGTMKSRLSRATSSMRVVLEADARIPMSGREVAR